MHRIAILQVRLNNHLLKNPLDRPIRVAFDQPDMGDLFSPVFLVWEGDM